MKPGRLRQCEVPNCPILSAFPRCYAHRTARPDGISVSTAELAARIREEQEDRDPLLTDTQDEQ